MRWQTIKATAILTLAVTFTSAVGCGGGDATAPTASVNASDESKPDTSPGSAAPPTTPAANTSPVTTTPATPATSRYSGAAATTTQAASSSRYPSFAGAKEIRVQFTTNKGDITIRLFSDKAPLTVENFLRNYVETSYYNSSIVHHVDPSMIVAGGFRENFSEIPATLPVRNEARNGLKNVRGTVAMGRLAENADSATSHFFFNIEDNQDFDHQGEKHEDFGYCVFGEVVEGMAVLDAIAKSPTAAKNDLTNVPVDPIVIKTAKVLR